MQPSGGPFAELWSPAGSPIDLFAEDALVGVPGRLRRGTVSVVVTSPPYNLGIAYSRYHDARPRAEYLDWVCRVGKTVRDVLAHDGSFFLNVGSPPKDPWLAWDVAREVRESLVLQNVIHWVKSIAIERADVGRASGLERDLAVGHYQPVPSRRFLHGAHEYLFHFTHRGDLPLDRLGVGVPYQDKSNVTRWRGGRADIRCRGNTWFLPYPTIRVGHRDRPHPASYPVELPERCIRLHGTSRVRLVLDPFLGIGASAVAALRLGLPFVGFDVDPAYLATARERLTREGAVLRERTASHPRALTRSRVSATPSRVSS